MNSRERLVNTFLFKPVDRAPRIEWPIREATMRRWISEGYPAGVSQVDYFKLDKPMAGLPVNMGMLPLFTEKVICQDGEYKIWQDELGAIRKDFADIEHPGFVTRTWLKFAVSNRQEFEDIKQRYRPAMAERYGENFAQRIAALNAGDSATHLSIPFLFWTARDWVGFENLCVLFYDDPVLVEDMFEFITWFCIENLKPIIDGMEVDFVELKEDMAYKSAPMISPAMFRRFMAPHYRKMIDFLKAHGAKLVYVDCDGYPGDELIAAWLDCGVDAMSPCEIAAGNDLAHIRAAFPKLGLFGGVDKRALARGYAEIDAEIRKIPPLLERGGYAPHIDHAIPYDVPLRNYLYYREKLDRIIG